MLDRHKKSIKTYSCEDIIYEKITGERNILKPRYEKQVIKDLGKDARIIYRNAIVHYNYNNTLNNFESIIISTQERITC